MKLDYLQEPRLEFGTSTHIDIRFGIMNYGPLDVGNSLAPNDIRVGIVGTPQTVEGVSLWLERCREEIPAKVSKQPNLFPKFPGCNADASFRTSLVLNSRLQRALPQREFDTLSRATDTNQVIREAVDRFVDELTYLAENVPADVLICAMPMSLLERMEQDVPAPTSIDPGSNAVDAVVKLDFHDLLKAKCLGLKVPIQLVQPMTYDPKQRRSQKRRSDRVKQLQDEATRAWNFHTALYYKANGIPWRLVREASDFATCYVGISFYNSLDKSQILTSIAQVFNERGEGVVVRGGAAMRSKEDRQIHLPKQDAYDLLTDALKRYREEHRTLPARVVLHKTSTFDPDELDGFIMAAVDQGVDMYDFLSIGDTFTRLFRTGAYPPLRGSLLSLDQRAHVLYTKGSVDFFETYPGMYVPRPLLFRCEFTEQTPVFLGRELLALTKMNYNNTQFDGGDPITTRAARQIGSILKYVGAHDPMASRYRFYM